MQLYPYLHFNGQCEEAFKFYEKCLGGKIAFMLPHEGTPVADKVPAEWGKKILHATLNVGDDVLQGADASPNNYQTPGFSVTINTNEPAEADRVFYALSENGTVRMPIQQTFWAVRFGMVTDRFGIPWMVNCGKPV